MELLKVVYIVLVLFLSTTCFSQTGHEKQDIASVLDGVLSGYVDQKEFMGSVLVAKDDRIILRKGYGYSDLENKVPNRPGNIYCIASVTKLFTLSGIHILSERGLLNFDDPLSKYIPGYPNGDQILIRHLTSNTSGIVDYINELQEPITDEQVSIDSLISIFKDHPQNFEPGEKYSYCNSGWILLASVIEKVSGLSYAEFLNENIFQKAAMNTTFSDWNSTSIEMAKGYHKENGAFVRNACFSPSQIIGAGNIVTTIDDLYK